MERYTIQKNLEIQSESEDKKILLEKLAEIYFSRYLNFL